MKKQNRLLSLILSLFLLLFTLVPQSALTVKAEGNSNTSLRGAALLLTRPELRERLVRWSSGCTLVDLAARPDFTALYMRHMVFG